MQSTGTQRRDEVLERLARLKWVREARKWAAEYAARHGRVTVDDVRRGFEPPPKGTDGRAYGAIFAGRQFEPIGWTTTKVKTSHARPIRVFRLASRRETA